MNHQLWGALQNHMMQTAQYAHLIGGAYQAQANTLLHGGGGGTYTPYKLPPVPDAGVSVGEIIAWRSWRVRAGFLQSMIVDTIWIPYQPMKAPDNWEDQQTGLHAFKTAATALEYGALPLAYTGNTLVNVVGQVELWGTVIEHELGYRAEYAAIKSLAYVMPTTARKRKAGWFRRVDVLEELRELYGVGGE